MLPLTRLTIFALAALLLPATASAEPPDPADAADPIAIVVPLEPVGASSVGGLATITPDPGDARRAVLVLEAEGLRAGAPHPVHVHAGSPAQPSVSFGLVGELVPDATGQGQLETATMTASAGGAPVDLSLDLLADGDHFLGACCRTLPVGAVAVVRW